MKTTPKQNRFYEIDLLRFFAALSVVLFHYGFRGYTADNMTAMPYPFFDPLAKYGYLGVNLFFIISGFVIFMTANTGSARRFIISRVVRLYPTFWVCCTATFIVIIIAGGTRYSASWQQYAVNMTMLNGFIDVESIDGSYWSLLIEMKFYALVLFVLIIRQIHNSKVLLGLWLAVVIFISQWPIHYVGFFLIPDYAPYFVAGAMFYLIHYEGVCSYKLFIIATSYFVALRDAIMKSSDMMIYYHTQIDKVVVAIVLTVFFIIFFLISTGRTKIFASERWLLLGALTYPLYLIHQNIGYIIFNLTYPRINPHILMAGSIATMLLVSYVIHIKVQKPYSRPFKVLLERLFRSEANIRNM